MTFREIVRNVFNAIILIVIINDFIINIINNLRIISALVDKEQNLK